MFQKNKINKQRLKDTISAFRLDYSQIMGVSDAKRLSGENETSGGAASVSIIAPTAWLIDLLPKNAAYIIGSSPEKVALLLASKELTEDEKKTIAAFFDVDQPTIERRLIILEKLLNTYFPDFGLKASLFKDDPHFQLLMEMISPFQKYHSARSHIQEQRRIKEFTKSKGVEV